MKAKHPIRVVVRRTGLSPHLIRMWERRYQAVQPERTDTGRRLYSDGDIERLILLRRGTLEGESISQLAGLSTKDLMELLKPEQAEESSTQPVDQSQIGKAEYHLNLCIEAISNLDAANLETRLLSASVALGQKVFMDTVLQPLLVRTGEMWSDGRLKVAHEHLASAVIRSLLGSMFVTMRTDSAGPVLLTTTPPGQLHEFGALMASVTAASIGWRPIYLGPNLPAEDIASAASERGARVIALSLVYPPDDQRLPLELKKLAQLLDKDVHVLAGGRAASSYSSVLQELNIPIVTSLEDLRQRLGSLREQIGLSQAG